MKITHKHLDELYRAYAASTMNIDDELVAFIASEEKGYPCYMYSGRDFNERETVWEDGGGCMSIIPIPDKENEFLAVRDFYLKESPSKARLVWGKYKKETGWEIKTVLYLPYLHRFDIYSVAGKNYVVLATIADEKEYKDDWRKPGSIYVGELPDDPSSGVELKKIASGLFRNHGYYRYVKDGILAGYFTSDEGIFKLTPHADRAWDFEKIVDGMIGEVALIDVNNDGKEELITIEPFHGNEICIYELDEKNHYQKVFSFDFELDFAHTLVGASLAGVNSFVGGIRRVGCELFYVQYHDGQYQVTIVDAGAGPANLVVASQGDREVIVSANHTRNEAAVYFVEKD